MFSEATLTFDMVVEITDAYNSYLFDSCYKNFSSVDYSGRTANRSRRKNKKYFARFLGCWTFSDIALC